MSLEDIELCLCDFIEATVHEVLHLRGIYSAELFQRQRLFNIAVRKSRHPKLTDYIHGVVQSIRVRARVPVTPPIFFLVDRSEFLRKTHLQIGVTFFSPRVLEIIWQIWADVMLCPHQGVNSC